MKLLGRNGSPIALAVFTLSFTLTSLYPNLSNADGRIDFMKFAVKEKPQKKRKDIYLLEELPSNVQELIDEAKAGLARWCEKEGKDDSKDRCSSLGWVFRYLWNNKKSFGFRAAKPSDFPDLDHYTKTTGSSSECLAIREDKSLMRKHESFVQFEGFVLPHSFLDSELLIETIRSDIGKKHLESKVIDDTLMVSDLYFGHIVTFKYTAGHRYDVDPYIIGFRKIFWVAKKQDFRLFRIENLKHSDQGDTYQTSNIEDDYYVLCWEPKRFGFDG